MSDSRHTSLAVAVLRLFDSCCKLRFYEVGCRVFAFSNTEPFAQDVEDFVKPSGGESDVVVLC